MSVPRKDWQWFGSPAHFICAKDCRFHMATLVGKYIVSTVGEMWSCREVREIHAKFHDAAWLAQNVHRRGDDFDHAYMQRFGFTEIGCQRTYETLVFKAGAPCTAKGCNCGLPALADACEIDGTGYNDAGAATRGHMKLCAKWARAIRQAEAA